jgi:hypothetical protein
MIVLLLFRFFSVFLSVLPLYLSIPLEINSPKVVKTAEFALQELSKLSDSNIYETLKLSKILSADEVDGLFHMNIMLHLELECPHFASRRLKESYHMIVMAHKEDNVTTLAIDEFPVMNEDAIEEFYIRKVERRRELREKAFEELEMEAMKLLHEMDLQENIEDDRSSSRQKIQEENEVSLSNTGDVEAVQSGSTEQNPGKEPAAESNKDEKKINYENLDIRELHNLLKKMNN